MERSFHIVSPMENKDERYLGRLRDYYAEHGVLPSYATVMALLGLKSKSPVAALVARLKLAGYLESSPDRRLKPGRRFFARPIFDSVRAGFPSPAGDTRHDMLTIDEYLVAHPSSTVLVTVKGDSMIDAGILPDDTVIVEKRSSANVGDMVVAIVDNEFTLKTLGKEKEQFVLKPANPAYPVIRPQGDLEIFGVVVGQFRKYK
jgi:SOS regulatory protein LexA